MKNRAPHWGDLSPEQKRKQEEERKRQLMEFQSMVAFIHLAEKDDRIEEIANATL